MAIGIGNIGAEDDVIKEFGWVASRLVCPCCNLAVYFSKKRWA
jgi:hypothetical protein